MHVGVRERDHAAVLVPDHECLLRPEQVVGDEQGPDRLVVDESARVADHVCVALLEAEEACGVEARVHAGDHHELPARRHGQAAFGESGRVTLVGLADLVDHGHRATSPGRCFSN